MARVQSALIGIGLGLYVSVSISGLAWAQTPMGTGFSYQGRLADGGAPASGLYDLQFTLFDAATGAGTIGTPVVVDDVTVASGLFTVMLDFGAAAFTGDARWLEIGVRPGASTDGFTPLASRQVLTPAPQAIFSQRSLHSTTSDNSVTSQSANAAPWAGITGKPAGFADDVDDDTLTTLGCSTAGHVAKWTGSAWSCATDGDATGVDWKLTGNVTGGIAFLGTVDNQPLSLIAHNQTALRLVSVPGGVQVLGGSVANAASINAGATIAGGGASGLPNQVTGDYGTVAGGLANVAANRAFVGGGESNEATGQYAVVGGGYNHTNSAPYATIGGGSLHTVEGAYATIGGGLNNEATGQTATVAGGQLNEATGSHATIAGGLGNMATNTRATVGGGEGNIASGWHSTIPGGFFSRATGVTSFAAGNRAYASHEGVFVWADASSTNPVESTGPHQFIVRAHGGLWFGGHGFAPDIPAGRFINTSTGAYLSSAGAWTNTSDRSLKEGFEPVDGARLLDQLARLPITSWRYKAAPGVRHIGPVAQDFQAIFDVGDSDKAISTIDPAGIALATIQELHRRLDAQTAALAAQTAAQAAQAADHAAALASAQAAARAHAAAQDAQIAALQAIVRELQQQMASRATEGGR